MAPPPRRAGYLVGEREHWGKGHTTEAVELAIGYAFHELNLGKVRATRSSWKTKQSRRALENNGFRKCGLFRAGPLQSRAAGTTSGSVRS